MEAASPSPSSALSFWTIRHIPSLHDPPLQEEDGKQPCKTRSHLRCVPSPGQDQNVLLILGGPQQYIELSLMGGCCLLLLYGLDTLLENCLTGGSMLCFDDGEVAGREVTFSVPSNARSNVLTVTDINHDDMYETRMEHSRNRKYIIELRFQLPQVLLPDPNRMTVPMQSDVVSDVVFLFPRQERRKNFLFARKQDLVAQSPYFAYLFASPESTSYGRHRLEGDEQTLKRELFRKLAPFRKRSGHHARPTLVDSDEDNERPRTKRSRYLQDMQCLKPTRFTEEVTFVIVKHASYRTFKTLLAYLQQGIGPDLTFIKSYQLRSSWRTLPAQPLSYSPKSLYFLAQQLQLPAVAKLAIAGYAKQITPATFSDELFSDACYHYPALRQVVVAAACSTTCPQQYRELSLKRFLDDRSDHTQTESRN